MICRLLVMVHWTILIRSVEGGLLCNYYNECAAIHSASLLQLEETVWACEVRWNPQEP
jgi:hypothetical protein